MANSNFRFHLSFAKLPDLRIQVVGFRGRAGLNELFSFEVTALMALGDFQALKGEELFDSPATLSIRDEARNDATKMGAPQAYDAKWHGILTGLELDGQVGDFALLHLGLGPTLSSLSDRVHNRIHLDSTSVDIVKDSLGFGGFDASRLSLRLDPSSYPKREFVFQREEDLLGFVLRTLGREGIALWYDQSAGHDGVVLSDSNDGFQSLLCGRNELSLTHTAASGLSPSGGEPLLHAFAVEKTVPPKTLRLRDYNWANPNQPLEILLTVDESGRGEHYLYGEHFESEGEGERLARIRKEGLLSRSELFRGTSAAPGLMPGMLFSLQGHPNGSYNQRYLVSSASYVGHQELATASGLPLPAPQGEAAPGLTVSLAFHSLKTPYRPPQVRPRPSLTGPVTAWIDGAGSGDSPELDAYGRYKVLLPLDASGRGQGKASCWVRMAQPYVGRGYGQGFPLTPGTEVLLSFLDGNPDRPVIQGAIPNGETGSVVNSSCPNIAGIGTKGGGSLVFGEDDGSQSVILDSGTKRGTISLTASSPTTALIQADKVATVSTVNGDISGIGDYAFTGMEHRIAVTANVIGQYNAMLTALQAAVQTANAVVSNLDPPSDEGSQRPATANTVASRALSLADMDFGSLWTLMDAYWSVQELKFQSPASPHRNLIAIKAGLQGSDVAYRSKMQPGSAKSQLMRFLAIANNALISLGCAADAEENIRDAVANPGTGKDKAAKILSTATAVSSDVTQIVMQLLSELATTLCTNVETKGVLVENTESYVAVKANGSAALSSKGPVYVESGEFLISDLLTDYVGEKTIPPHFVKRDLPPSDSPADSILPPFLAYLPTLTAQAVVLRGEVVRALAQEVDVAAQQAIIAKARKGFMFLTGKNRDYNVARNQPLNRAAMEPSAFQSITNMRKTQVPPNLLADFNNKDIIFKTYQDTASITLETADPSSNISLAQGTGDNNEIPRTLSLTKDQIELKAANNLCLTLNAAETPKVSLSSTDKSRLDITSDALNLQLSDGNSLKMDGDGLTLQHAKTISLVVSPGNTRLQLGSDGISHNASGSMTVTGKFVQIC